MPFDIAGIVAAYARGDTTSSRPIVVTTFDEFFQRESFVDVIGESVRSEYAWGGVRRIMRMHFHGFRFKFEWMLSAGSGLRSKTLEPEWRVAPAVYFAPSGVWIGEIKKFFNNDENVNVLFFAPRDGDNYIDISYNFGAQMAH